MRREILNGIPDADEKAVRAFVDQNKESALKVKPKVSAIFLFLSFPSKYYPLSPIYPQSIPKCSMVANTSVISATTILASSYQVNHRHEMGMKTSGHRVS